MKLKKYKRLDKTSKIEEGLIDPETFSYNRSSIPPDGTTEIKSIKTSDDLANMTKQGPDLYFNYYGTNAMGSRAIFFEEEDLVNEDLIDKDDNIDGEISSLIDKIGDYLETYEGNKRQKLNKILKNISNKIKETL
jgi:hypothetical protein